MLDMSKVRVDAVGTRLYGTILRCKMLGIEMLPHPRIYEWKETSSKQIKMALGSMKDIIIKMGE